jgi:predicted TIM-barrel fold metal-dependent hydrolase
MIDCDVHNAVPSVEALLPYLEPHWQEHVRRSGWKGPDDDAYPPGSAVAGPRGAGTSLDDVRAAVLEDDGARAVLTCAYGVDAIRNPDFAAAIAAAVNDWQLAEWLEPEPRLRGSVVVPIVEPGLAAREIDRVGGHPGFVQVLLPVRSARPYGTRGYAPVFDAAARNGLAVALHFGGSPGNPPTASGWPSFYVEEYAGMATVFQSQLMSILVEGVLDRTPETRLALVESGFAWLPAFLWRLDKEWKGLRRETPWVRRPPSAYVQEHVRLTLQPFDCPRERFPQVLDRLGSDELLLYASDYPHGHAASAGELRALLPERVLEANAAAFYRWAA